MTAAAAKKKPVKHNRGHLSRDLITKAGLTVARKEGVDNLTMKRLAQELLVTPMAVYRHFEDKADLIDAVLDRYVQEQDICNHDVDKTDWSNWLAKTYSKMYYGLQSMPSVYPYLSSASRFGPGAVDVVTQSLDTLEAAGFDRARAAQAANALNGFVIGCAIMDNAFYESIDNNQEDSAEGLEPGLETGLELIISALKQELESKQNIKSN